MLAAYITVLQGIEIGSQSLMNITIRENMIYNNSGAAVVVDADPSTAENYTYTITIMRNEVWDNGAGLVPEFQAGGAMFTCADSLAVAA